MPQKRSRDQIIAKILDTCMDGANKTKIVYLANLNFRTVNRPLDLLQKKGFLEATQGERVIYHTTQEGAQALETLRKAEEIYS
jgi:predicted transcriptional regulator